MESIDLEIPAERAGHLRIGTCSWKYESWKGLIYRDGVAYEAGDYLGQYAERLGAVEVDQWFWSLFPAGIKLPDPRAVAAYAASVPDGFEFAVETRNPNFLRDEFFDLLRAHGAGYVFIDGYHMPPIGEVASRFDATDLPFVVIRLHGGDRKDIEERTGEVWDTVVDPRPEGLRAAADIVRAGERRGRRTYVFANNHYEGSAPLTLVRFLDVLRADASPF